MRRTRVGFGARGAALRDRGGGAVGYFSRSRAGSSSMLLFLIGTVFPRYVLLVKTYGTGFC